MRRRWNKNVVQAELQDNPKWADKADKKMIQAWRAFLEKVDSFDLSEVDSIDA